MRQRNLRVRAAQQSSIVPAPRADHPVSPHLPSQPPAPTHRHLRGYAFDPSLATKLETALVSEITYKVPWEALEPGPIGEYVEVVDFDPPSDCFYAPVHLDHPAVLAERGLTPSEGNPQFHQQMVYAAAMTTIDRFEQSLGRKAFWTDRFERGVTLQAPDQFVQRLRLCLANILRVSVRRAIQPQERRQCRLKSDVDDLTAHKASQSVPMATQRRRIGRSQTAQQLLRRDQSRDVRNLQPYAASTGSRPTSSAGPWQS